MIGPVVESTANQLCCLVASITHVETVPASQHGFNYAVAFCKTNSSWTSFVDEVKRCFRGSAETAEAGRRDYLANAFFA